MRKLAWIEPTLRHAERGRGYVMCENALTVAQRDKVESWKARQWPDLSLHVMQAGAA